MKRVMIVGGPGSGKSTLARMLSTRTGLPVFHMDWIHWQAGWIERSREEKERLIREVQAREVWIFEGGHSRLYAERVARADTLVWLDFPVAIRIRRVLWRAIRSYGQNRPDLPEGCPERLGLPMLTFLGFIWRTRNSAREKIQNIVKNPPPHLDIHHLRNLVDVERFLKAVDRTTLS